MNFTLGVDIGGTKIAAGIIDEKGNCVEWLELPSIKTDREAMFAQVVLCIDKLLRKSQFSVQSLKGIGIGVPGKVDTENGIAIFQNNLPWADFPLVERVKKQFPVENIVIDNDVYMAAFAEWKIRGGDVQTFVYLTISTGISCCTIHNGNIIRGTGFAGEVGFLPINEKGQRLEEVASGPGIEKLANLHFLAKDENAVKISTKKVLEDHKSKKPYAVNIITDISVTLAKGIHSITCLLDPNKLVLGGGVVNHNPELIELIKDSLNPYLAPDQIDLLNRIEVSQLKGNAGLIGAGLRTHSVSLKRVPDGGLNL